MRHPLRIVLALVLSGISTAALAQAAPPAGVLMGTLRDAATRAPLRRGVACVTLKMEAGWQRMRCADADSAGVFRLDSLPPGRNEVSLGCTTLGPFARTLTTLSVQITGTGPVLRDVPVATTGCDPRPVRRVTGEFSGHYTGGFEQSDFVPCARSGWFIPGDSLGTGPGARGEAWVDWTASRARPGTWPTPERTAGGGHRFFVRWKATVAGPGHYGHMGISPFEMTVDRIVETRTPARDDCG